ncbi:MAG: TIGR03545 family protein [Bacteroides sp.]|nr:TIGR03545 family protein [Prevotella sp.]MCM1407887.1 TIGR03545 family protein [Treponema brennaborense]MCM1469629.1 TIGR03545 family protein [Bacteroides sp.]
MKKLPAVFRKKYTEKKLQQKIYKRIFIPDDEKFIRSLFEQSGVKGKKQLPLFSVSQTRDFSKAEFKRLSKISKQIRKKSARIKFIPLAACAAFAAAVCIVIAAGKNVFVKKGIQSACEAVFGAKCDIAAVEFKIFDSSLVVRGLAVADKSTPMKNLFTLDSVIVDFDLVQLLKAKFAADNLSAAGIAFGSPRTVSGELPASRKKKKEKEQTEKNNASQSAFAAQIAAKASAAADSIKSSFSGMFSQYNPQTIIESCYSRLKSPSAADQVKDELQRIAEEWQKKPAELEKSASAVIASAEKAASIDLNSLKTNPAQIKDAIEIINKAFSDAKSFKTETEEMVDSIQNDAKSIQSIAESVQSAVQHDIRLANNEISKITSFNIEDGKRFLTDTLDAAAYQIIGKYYPYIQKAVSAAAEIQAKSAKQSSAKKEPAKAKKSAVHRNAGRMVYYKKDTVPSFLIKKTQISGAEFNVSAADISNDMDLWGKPAAADILFTHSGITHSAGLTVDARSTSKQPLISAEYAADKVPFSFSTARYIQMPGLPAFSGTGAFKLSASADSDSSFNVSGGGSFSKLNITSEPFEPEFASKLYAKALANITSMRLDIDAAYREAAGISMALSSNADEQFMNALKTLMNSELNAVKEAARKELTAKISEITNGVLGDITSLTDIKEKINEYAMSADQIKRTLEEKLNEAESYLKKQAEAATAEAAEKLKEQAEKAKAEAEEELKKQAEEAASKLIENISPAADEAAEKLKNLSIPGVKMFKKN